VGRECRPSFNTTTGRAESRTSSLEKWAEGSGPWSDRCHGEPAAVRSAPMSTDGEFRLALELGCDHTEYGRYTLGRLSARTVWAISVGADPTAPSLAAKGDPEQPNEDALLAAEQGDRVLLVVADAHFGRESSHELLRDLSEQLAAIPVNSEQLAALLRQVSKRDPTPDYASDTSLLIAVFDRAAGEGFGVSFGDSTFAIVGDAGQRQPVAPPRAAYVSPANPASLDPEQSDSFVFTAMPGDLLLAYTDGIDECHYCEPETSVTPRIMANLWREAGNDPEAYVRRLVELALSGTDGNPGGQDNLAVVATRV